MINRSRIVNCVEVVFVAVVASFLLAAPLIGTRGAPWINFGFWQIIIWFVVGVICRALLDVGFASKLGNSIGNWYRAGGCWLVLSKNNAPGNTWIVIAVLAIVNAFSYGPPTPGLDVELAAYNAQVLIQGEVADPKVQRIGGGAKDIVNHFSKLFIGSDVIVENKTDDPIDKPIPRYERGWSKIGFALFAIIFATLVFILGRRDEMADKFSGFADHFKKKRESSGSASTEEGDSGSTASSGSGQTTHGTRVADHMVGEFLSRMGESFFSWSSRLMKKY
jgi:hypothetical protein